jgi:hypothetical protein
MGLDAVDTDVGHMLGTNAVNVLQRNEGYSQRELWPLEK